MKLLLDTHIYLGIVNETEADFPHPVRSLLDYRANDCLVSVATLWEIAIKHRLGKLPLSVPLSGLPVLATALGIDIIGINADHVLTDVDPEPPTRDPFDRLLLAQCQVEGMRLVTIDRALVRHRLSATA